MVSFLGLVQVIAGPSGHHILLMADIVQKHVQKVHDLWLVVDQGQHNNAEGVLKLGMLEELVQYYVGIGVVSEFNDHPHAFPVGFVSQVGNAFDLFILDQFRDLLDQVGLVDQVGKLRHHDPALAVSHGLDIRHSPGNDLAPACPVG